MDAYVLEVQQFINHLDERKSLKGIFRHVGIMDIVFCSKEEAIQYYNIHNPHMRALNAHGGDSSDWDPETLMRYVVRKYDRETREIEPFN